MKLFRGRQQPDEPTDIHRLHPGPVENRSQIATPAEKRGQRLHELAVLSLFLHSAGTMEEMMALFLERSPRVTGAVLTYPLLLDRRRDILTAQHLGSVDDPGLEAASMAANENFSDLEYPLPLRSWRRAIMEGGEVTITDDMREALAEVLTPDQCREVKRAMNITRVATVPLVMEGEAFGICLFMFAHEEPDVELLELVAGHTTLALKGIASGEEAARFGGIDPVTWAHSRTYFLESLEAEVARAKRFGREACIVLLDIDDFGEFNGSYGHTMGDRLLRAVAMSLAAPLATPEFVARYGGDEFAILLPEASRQEGQLAVREAVSDLGQLSIFDSTEESAGVSVCYAMVSYPEDGGSREELLAAAEHEMARVKELKRASRRQMAA
jgi:diguanylate cyclase (GGDEF)-like protein